MKASEYCILTKHLLRMTVLPVKKNDVLLLYNCSGRCTYVILPSFTIYSFRGKNPVLHVHVCWQTYSNPLEFSNSTYHYTYTYIPLQSWSMCTTLVEATFSGERGLSTRIGRPLFCSTVISSPYTSSKLSVS